MRWGQIQDDKGRRAVCMHEETIYELPAKLSPLLQFYSRYRTNFGDPANVVSILRENGATTLGHGEELWNTLRFVRPLDRPGKVLCAGLNYRDHAEEWDSKSRSIPPSSRNIQTHSSAPTKKFRCLLQTKPEAQK